jgi:hypothetical protein
MRTLFRAPQKECDPSHTLKAVSSNIQFAADIKSNRTLRHVGREGTLDLAQLESLGKVAGIGGIAIGALVLVISGIVAKTSSVPAKQRAATLRLLAIGAFGIGALGIVAWVAGGWGGGQHASTRGDDSPAVISGGNVTIGPASLAVGSTAPQTGTSPNATAKTQGSRSPAVISGGDVVVSPQINSAKPSTP